ncbi:MAG: hydrolase, partial [Albidovulum sp.]|nr:hydrolase [Albidovulum sp.]
MNSSECSLTLGIWQDTCVPGDVAANLAAVSGAAATAAGRGVELLVFPECFLTGYFNSGGAEAVARKVDKNVINSLHGIAKTNAIALLVGLYELRPSGVHNAALLIGANGEPLATYRKRALYGEWERTEFMPGKAPVLVEYRGIRIAVLICFDLEFPELARECARNGADLIAVPTALMEPFGCVARHLVPTRAFENQVYVAYANRTGRESGIRYHGHSSICGPDGNRLVSAKDSG